MRGPSCLVVAGAAMLGIGCEDASAHVYAARLFVPDRDCLSSYTAVDAVSGPEATLGCEPACLEGGGSTYLSTMCPPYPLGYAVTTPTDSGAALSERCQSAFRAFTRDDKCLDDGGTTHPAAGDAGGVGPEASTMDAPGDAL